MIEIKDLSFNYKGEERLFSSLSLNIEAHHPVLILSPPGSGKTTLARILTGTAEKYYWGERSGTFLIDDVDLFALDIPERKNYVARSSQNSDEAILFPTLLDEIAFPLEQRNLGRKRIREELEGLLKRYDLEKYSDSDTSELSGGEKRRLNLATLDAIAPRFYIYDEAFDELSSSWRSKLLSLIKEKEYVLVLGSHYLGEYDDLFDSVYEIRDGHLVPYEPRDVFFSFPCLKDAEDPHLLRLEDISFSQRHRAMEEGGLFSLSVPSFEMKSSSLYLLTGENGAGKSTLARIITGIREPDNGRIVLDGKEIRAKDRKKKVSYLFQNPFNQLYLPTVKDELLSVSRNEELISHVASLFSLSLDDYTQELSYGKAKLLQGAIFYILNRPFAIFDEVDSAISYEDTMTMLRLYLESGTAVLMISHDERIISAFKGERYHIEKGVLR